MFALCVYYLVALRAHLLISVEEVHEALMMVVVMGVLGSVGREEQVVGTQTMPLSVSI